MCDAVWDRDMVNVARLLHLRMPPDDRDSDGRLALSIAIQNKDNAIAKLLLDKKAKINLQDDSTLFSPLHVCIMYAIYTLYSVFTRVVKFLYTCISI